MYSLFVAVLSTASSLAFSAEQQETTIGEASKSLSSVFDAVTPHLSQGLVVAAEWALSGSGLAVWVSKNGDEGYEVVFVTRRDIASGASYDETVTRQTMNYEKVFLAVSSSMTVEQERVFNEVLNKQGEFEVVNLNTVTDEDAVSVRSTQEVRVAVADKEQLAQIVGKFLSLFPKESKVFRRVRESE